MTLQEAFHTWPREVQDEVLGELERAVRWTGWLELKRSPVTVAEAFRKIIDVAGNNGLHIEEFT